MADSRNMHVDIVVPVRKRVPINTPTSTGFTTVPDVEVHAKLEIEIDFEKLARLLGPRALHAKNKLATLAGGAIKARIARGSERKVGGV